MKRKGVLTLILLLVFLLIGVGIWTIRPRTKTPVGDERATMVTSIYPLAFFAEEIGKEKLRVINLTPAGIEPHDYEPTVRDMMKIQKAQLLITNGGNMETWSEKIKTELSGVKVIEAGKGLFVGNDAHIWLSPRLAKIEVGNILAAIVQMDPANEKVYSANAAVLAERLDKLSTKYKRGLADCQMRELVTSHAAFGYLTTEFGLRQIPISGLAPDEEPSTKKIAEITRVARESGTKYIFFETLVSPKLAETIAKEIGARTMVLDPLEGISDEGLSLGKNYFTIMEDNLANLRTALECR